MPIQHTMRRYSFLVNSILNLLQVMLLSMPEPSELYAKCIGLQSDGTTKDDGDVTTLLRAVNFLVG
jgi:hypothetical protein